MKTGTSPYDHGVKKNSFAFAFTILVACMLSLTDAQTIGVDICSCTPSEYTFKLDFSLTPCPLDVSAEPGIEASSCIAQGIEPGTQDLTPVMVKNIAVFELGQNFQVVAQDAKDGPFMDGDSFPYSSITSFSVLPLQNLPIGLQMTMSGINALNEELVVTWAVFFSTECRMEAIFEEGMELGLTILESLTPPLEEYCPGATIMAPTGSPVAVPETGAPTEEPAATTAPTETPVATSAPSMATPTPGMSMSMSMSFQLRRGMEQVMKEADLFEFGRAM